MTVWMRQKIAVTGCVFCLALMGGGAYFFDVAGMMPTRMVWLPDIQFDAKKTTDQGYSALSGDLFGPLPDIEITLTETNLNLTLKGTVPVFNQQDGMAIIMVGAKDEQALRVGDEVLRGVTLDAVYGQYVVLSRSNGKEVLRFPNSDEQHKLLPLGTNVAVETLPALEEEQEASIGFTVSD
ncbi:type II secretion system protein N [Marinomonas transparens]|uniref:Type II secretion system protein GspC N-terminal domain-containing protein n=1 Tax=Marinomonas transparens TaxID=2795388 RepID=A0A934N3J4_9GAMM|nr:type II secretion system protein N [Marinomonas transparens]MBJ7539063.1 hypothetical protein [Marinomonas transparens]